MRLLNSIDNMQAKIRAILLYIYYSQLYYYANIIYILSVKFNNKLVIFFILTKNIT